MQFTCRNFTEKDIDELVHFWNHYAKWDAISREVWEHRFLKSPGGAPVIMLALYEGEIAGQFAFVPMPLQIDEQRLMGYRPFAIIIKKEIRKHLNFLGLLQVLRNMYLSAVAIIRQQDGALIYALPDPRWEKAIRFFPEFQTGSFPLWSKPLPIANINLPEPYRMVLLPSNDVRITTVWEQCRPQLYQCSIVRDAEMLSWRTRGYNCIFLGLEKAGALVGISVSKEKPADKQWLIEDVLAIDGKESLQWLLNATCAFAQVTLTAAPEKKLNKVAILAAPALQPALTAIGFKEDAYQFLFILHPLHTSLTKSQLAPERWYLSAND